MTHRNDSHLAAEPELRDRPRRAEVLAASRRLASRLAIAGAIIDARLARGWTQEDLATAAGTTQSRISELESVRGNPTLDTVDRVAEVLELSLSLQPRMTAPRKSAASRAATHASIPNASTASRPAKRQLPRSKR